MNFEILPYFWKISKLFCIIYMFIWSSCTATEVNDTKIEASHYNRLTMYIPHVYSPLDPSNRTQQNWIPGGNATFCIRFNKVGFFRPVQRKFFVHFKRKTKWSFFHKRHYAKVRSSDPVEGIIERLSEVERAPKWLKNDLVPEIREISEIYNVYKQAQECKNAFSGRPDLLTGKESRSIPFLVLINIPNTLKTRSKKQNHPAPEYEMTFTKSGLSWFFPIRKPFAILDQYIDQDEDFKAGFRLNDIEY